jgi:pyridoxal biosynthesis lyase PdxS
MALERVPADIRVQGGVARMVRLILLPILIACVLTCG